MKNILIAFVFLPIILISCSPQQLEEFGDLPCDVYGDSTVVNLKYAEFAGSCAYTAKFESLISESRCPIGAACVTDGFAQIGVFLNIASVSSTRLDTLVITGSGIGIPKVFNFNGNLHRVRLLSLVPAPTNAIPLPSLSSYKAKVSVVRL